MSVGPMPDNLDVLAQMESADEVAGLEFDLSGASACPVSTVTCIVIYIWPEWKILNCINQQ